MKYRKVQAYVCDQQQQQQKIKILKMCHLRSVILSILDF